MVNIIKRMRKLDERLLRIRSGPGAATLPPPSTKIPFVTRIHLTHPWGPGTFTPRYHGSRLFWKTHLPRLKFHNPALPITVTHENAGGNIKTGHTEGDNTTGETQLEEPTEDSSSTPSKIQSDAEAQLTVYFDDTLTTPYPEGKTYEDYIPSNTTTTSPTESPTKPATSTRTATLDTRDKSAPQIWSWLQSTIGALPITQSAEDKQRMDELNAFKSQAEEDRKLVKKGMDSKRAHDAMLRQARGDAEKMRGDV